jgi:nucleotide-binding universal stress UspA family protein
LAGSLFEKVLIAVDGSEKNRAVIEEGVRIMRVCNARGYAVYVSDTGTLSSGAEEVPLVETYEILKEEAEKAFEWVKSFSGDTEPETVLLEGRPASEIVKFAVEKEIDLIVIGTQGKKGLERLLLGSVAEEVIRSASCKVLVVK